MRLDVRAEVRNISNGQVGRLWVRVRGPAYPEMFLKLGSRATVTAVAAVGDRAGEADVNPGQKGAPDQAPNRGPGAHEATRMLLEAALELPRVPEQPATPLRIGIVLESPQAAGEPRGGGHVAWREVPARWAPVGDERVVHVAAVPALKPTRGVVKV